MARKSKRKSRSINWTPILWMALTFNIVLAMLFSPLTSIRHLRIIGAQPHDLPRFNELSKKLRGKPFMSVSPTEFESSVLASRDVYDAQLSHNLFGSAILRLKYRTPVAVLDGSPHTYLD